jgi:hypothetical protein
MESNEETRLLLNRYYAFRTGSEEDVMQSLLDLCEAQMLDFAEPDLDDLDAEQAFEAYGDPSLSAVWQEANEGYLLIIDVSYDENYGYLLEEFEDSLNAVFDQSILVFSELGRERNFGLFQQISDLENALRELVVQKMMEHSGVDWWGQVLQGLQDRSRARKQNETESLLYDCYPHHELFYIEFDDLHRLVEDACVVFDPVFRHRDRINLADEIAKLNELRNRVMHGRYLTDDNEESIKLACRMFERILHLHVKMLEVRQLGGR